MPHIMLSYNWDHQKLVERIYDDLTRRGIICWMDKKGDMKKDMAMSMAKGVQNATAVIVFCTKAYQQSANCQSELNYAWTLKVPIIPVICDENYTEQQERSENMDPAKWPCDWLGLRIAGNIYVDFRRKSSGSFNDCSEQLVLMVYDFEVSTGFKCTVVGKQITSTPLTALTETPRKRTTWSKDQNGRLQSCIYPIDSRMNADLEKKKSTIYLQDIDIEEFLKEYNFNAINEDDDDSEDTQDESGGGFGL